MGELSFNHECKGSFHSILFFVSYYSQDTTVEMATKHVYVAVVGVIPHLNVYFKD